MIPVARRTSLLFVASLIVAVLLAGFSASPAQAHGVHNLPAVALGAEPGLDKAASGPSDAAIVSANDCPTACCGMTGCAATMPRAASVWFDRLPVDLVLTTRSGTPPGMTGETLRRPPRCAA